MNKIEEFFNSKNIKSSILYYLVGSMITLPIGIISLLSGILLKPYIREALIILIAIVQILAIGIVLFLIISFVPIYKFIKEKHKKYSIVLLSIVVIFSLISLILLAISLFINPAIKAYKEAIGDGIKMAVLKINILKYFLITSASVYILLGIINSLLITWFYLKLKRNNYE